MAKKKGDEYFSAMAEMARCAENASAELDRIFRSFRPEELEAAVSPLHETERRADEILHKTMKKLVHEFITPIEREDIAALLACLDDTVDLIEDTAIKANMYGLTEIRSEGIELCELIKKSTSSLVSLAEEFPNYSKSKRIGEIIEEINCIEEEADRVYQRAVKRLYREEKDPIKVIAWTRMFEGLEKCCDSAEHIACRVETAIIKNM